VPISGAHTPVTDAAIFIDQEGGDPTPKERQHGMLVCG
jgi:hypothetical protein